MDDKEKERIQKEIDRFWSDPKAARNHLAKIYHPDVNPPDMRDLCNEIMKDINEEYEHYSKKKK